MNKHIASRHHDGFTLIEMLVVMVIIAIATSAITIAAGGYFLSSKRIEIFSQQITELFKLARQQAIFSNSVIGINVSAHHIAFLKLNNIQEFENLGKSDPFWRRIDIPEDLYLDINSSGKTTIPWISGSPQIVIYPSGEITSFTLTINQPDSKKKYDVISNSNGDITLIERDQS